MTTRQRHVRRVLSRAGAVLVASALLAGLAASPAAAAPGVGLAAAPGDAYQPVACDELGVNAAVVPADLANVECGRLSVPERRSVPGSAAITLAVFVARSTAATRQPDPLVMAQGGPGGATIETYLTDPELVISGPLAAGRDVVLFDQRGTGRSVPALNCPEQIDLTIRTAELDLPTDEEIRQSVEALGACRTRLVAEGVDLAGYTTVENAADVEALRVALGYQQINFYGVSYGTALGLEVARNYRQGLRSLILDGVVPPQGNFNESVAVTLDAAMTEFFNACAADPRCAAAFPDLEATFGAQVQRLDREPARVPLTDPESGTTYLVPMGGDDLQGLLFQLLYATPLLGVLPQLIYDVRDDRFDALGRIAGQLVFDRSVAYGMYYSVECAEDGDVTPGSGGGPGLRPSVAQLGADGVRQLVDGCARWGVPPLGPAADAPVTSDVPTLLLSGRFDPVTPEDNAAVAAATLSRAYQFTFPNTGHGAFGSEPCAAEILGAFLADPTVRPADGCLATLGPPRFITAADVVRLPGLLRLANLEGRSGVELAVFAGALLVLLTGWLLLPMAWLIRRLQGVARPGPPARLARSVPWLVVLDALVLVGFAVALVTVFVAAISTNEAALLLGLPSDAAWILVLPVVAMVLAVAIAVGVAQGLRLGGWRVWRRLYLSLLGLAALSCAVLLGVWGVG